MPFDSRYCDDPLPYNDTIKRFDARYWHIDYPLTAVATITSPGDSDFFVYSRHRSNRDLVGVLWSSGDGYGHPSLSYETNWGYVDNILCFQADIPNPYEATVTVNAGAAYVCRLFPYRLYNGRLYPWFTNDVPWPGAGDRHLPSYDFNTVTGGKPQIPGLPYFIVDFNNLYAGFNIDGDKVPPYGITSLFFSLTTSQYGLGTSATVKDEGLIKATKFRPSTIEYITVYCNPGTIISKGDVFLLTINTPQPRSSGGGFLSKPKIKYSWTPQTLTLQAQEFVMNDTSKEPYGFKIKLAKPIQAAWRGIRATAQTLRRDTPVGDVTINVQFRNINISGGALTLGKRLYPNLAHEVGMTSGFDDTYNITPWRQIDQAYQLGYRGFWTTYMGMSHYFKAYGTLVNGAFKVELEQPVAEPLNEPTVKHLEDLFTLMAAYGYNFVWSTAYEILNSVIPETWKQRDADQNPALTGWSPPSSFIVPTFDPCLDYLSNVIKQGMGIMQAKGMPQLNFQVGEPWWWDGSYSNRMPCIYDPFTRNLYFSETGNTVPTPWIRDFMEPVTEAQRPYLEWLGTKLARSTKYIADSVKAAYPGARSTLLFFTPQIMNPAAEMLTIINFPKDDWVYPNYDFMQIEDYDWLINGQMELHLLTFTAALDILGYPAELVHYFVGFVNTAREKWVWPNMNIAIWDAQDAGIGQVSVWAYPQVIRDGMFYIPGPRPTPPDYPPLPRIHAQDNVDSELIKPMLLVNINDEAHFWSGVGQRTVDGQVWEGVGYLGKISNTEETLQGTGSGWTMQLIGIPLQTYSEVIKPRRGQPVTLFMSVNGATTRVVVSGVIYEQSVELQAGQLNVTYRMKNALSLMRDSYGGTYTMNEQLIQHPGDVGLEFVGAMRNFKIDWGQ